MNDAVRYSEFERDGKQQKIDSNAIFIVGLVGIQKVHDASALGLLAFVPCHRRIGTS